MGARHHPLKGAIARLYAEGLSRAEIAARLGVSSHVVLYHTTDQINSDKIASLPFGRIAIGRKLTASQIVTLDKLARKWGCESLGEAALEIVRDCLEEQND